MTARPLDQKDEHRRDKDRPDSGSESETGKGANEGRNSLMRFARMAMRRKPALILLILSVCLILTVLYSWQLVRNGDVSGLILVGANLCAFVIALVYLADDLLRR